MFDFTKSGLKSKFRKRGTFTQGVLAACLALQVSSAPTVLEAAQVEAGKAGLVDHVRNVKHDYVVNWHHSQLGDALEKVQSGEIKRLMVLMPPRHGKSELVSRHFPAWCLGKNPDEKIIACSYDATLASMMGVDVQRIMRTAEYQDTFSTRLAGEAKSKWAKEVAKDAKKQERFFEVANGEGYYIGAGIGGPITGKGMTLGIIDDPIKNQEEADSELIRKKVWNWYTSTFLSRGEGAMSLGGEERIVVCLTPWHEDDLSGRILKQAKADGEKWVVIRFPAVRDDEKSANCGVYKGTDGFSEDPREIGEALWPWKYTTDKLKSIEAKSARTWNALYQCRPAPESGNMFKREWWKYYDSVAELPRAHAYCFTLDAAFKDLDSSSYVVLQYWQVTGPNRYLIEQWRGHYDYSATRRLCQVAFKKYPGASTKLIEEKANGSAIISELVKDFQGIVPVKPTDPKHVRALAVQSFVEGGNVYLPKFLGCSEQLVDEAAAFPFGKFDDQVDAMVQFLLHFQSNAVSFLSGMVA